MRPPPICDVLNRIRGSVQYLDPAAAVGAAAVRDREHFWKAVEHNNKWLPWITAEIRKTGLRVDDSVANFVLIHFPAEGEKTAAKADAFLTRNGVILRGRRRLRPAQLPAHDGRRRGSQPAGGEAVGRIHGGMSAAFDKIAIIGLGLIGSSIAHAARRGGLAKEIAGHDASPDVLDRAGKIGFCDTLHADIGDCVEDAQLVILCAPVGAYKQLAEQIAPSLAKGAILSDVGSVKGAVIRDVGPFVPQDVHFIPAHPIAGTEFSGPEAGFASLFDGRWAILTPVPGSDKQAVEKLKAFWQGLGSQVDVMECEPSRSGAGHHLASAASDRLQYRRHRP